MGGGISKLPAIVCNHDFVYAGRSQRYGKRSERHIYTWFAAMICRYCCELKWVDVG